MLAATKSETQSTEQIRRKEQPMLNQGFVQEYQKNTSHINSDTMGTKIQPGVYMSIHTKAPIVTPRLDQLPNDEKNESDASNLDGIRKHATKEHQDGFTSSPLKNPMYSNISLHRHKDLEDTDFSVNPDAIPYQPSTFMSSTVLKKVPIPRRHQDTFGHSDFLNPKRGVILHTDRYSWDTSRSLDGLSQRQRIEAEMDYIEKTRGMQRKRELIQHRAPLDLLMGGKKIDMEERFDLNREIQKLKSLVLPAHARELYHGKGFKLPSNHSSIKPRHALDFNEGEDSPIPTMTDGLNLDFGEKRRKRDRIRFNRSMKKDGNLPQINKHGSLIGTESMSTILKSAGL